MVNVDISNIWCSVTLPVLLQSEEEIANAHAALTDAPGTNFLSWLDSADEETARVMEVAQCIRATSQVLVVVGNESAVLGAQAALDLCVGRHFNQKNTMQVLFVGSDFSTTSWTHLSEVLEGQHFCVQVISRKGEQMQSAVTLRALRWLLERRYGAEKARERIFITTDSRYGFLRKLSISEGYCAFTLPRMLAGHSSVLCAGALLPLAVCGVDISEILDGALDCRTATKIRSFDNSAWLYAAARMVLSKKGKTAEYLCTAEPDAWNLTRWWQRLFAERGKLGQEGLLPVAAEIPADLGQMHEMLCDGSSGLLHTIIRFAPPEQKVPVEMDWIDGDGLNFLDGFTLDYLQEQSINGFMNAASENSVPILTMDCDTLSPRSIGELLYFFELSSCLCGGMLGKDVYEDEKTPEYAKNMVSLLESAGG